MVAPDFCLRQQRSELVTKFRVDAIFQRAGRLIECHFAEQPGQVRTVFQIGDLDHQRIGVVDNLGQSGRTPFGAVGKGVNGPEHPAFHRAGAIHDFPQGRVRPLRFADIRLRTACRDQHGQREADGREEAAFHEKPAVLERYCTRSTVRPRCVR